MITEVLKPNISDRKPLIFFEENSLKEWIENKAKQHNLKYLLAHAEDGVIWGRFDSGLLITSGDVFPEFAKLRSLTLQECRVFGEEGEVHLWRYGKQWRCHFTENKTPDIKEGQILWGTHGEKKDGFTLLRDGSQGLSHAVPFTDIEIDANNKLVRRVRLIVHHYIEYDEAGIARISHSRLVDLTAKEN
jgi:CRISPR-associated protein (TIGR03984 family)